VQFEGALIREQGVSFAVVIVRQQVLQNRVEADHTITAFQPAFAGIPILLMAQDAWGEPSYYGRSDLSRFMATVPLSAVRWRRFTVN
jgi:hypothetical protein